MAEASPLAFSVRDILRRIFPTVIAICLFAPLFNRFRGLHEIENIIFAGVVLSYLVSAPVRKGSDYLFMQSPFWRKRVQEQKTRRAWVNRNWNYQLLHEYLTKDELELIDEDGNLVYFYRAISFYFLTYLVVLLGIVQITGFDFDLTRLSEIETVQYWKDVWSVLVNARASVLAVGEIPIVIVVPAVALLAYFSIKESVQAYEYTFLEGGIYPNLSEKYHREKGDIALSIWGEVLACEAGKSDTDGSKPIPGGKVRLLRNDLEIAVAETNERGYFQFPNRFGECVDKTCVVTVQVGAITRQETRTFSRTSRPNFTFRFPTVAANARPRRVAKLINGGRFILRKIFMSTDEKIKQLLTAADPAPEQEASRTSSHSMNGYAVHQGIRSIKFSDQHKETAVVSTLLVLQPANAALLPGALVGVKSLENCELVGINLKRAARRLRFQNLLSSEPAAAEEVKLIPPESIQAAVQDFAGKIRDGVPKTSYLAQQFYSTSHALRLVDASRSWLSPADAQTLAALDATGKTNFIARLVTEYFEVSVPPLTAADVLFAGDANVEDAKKLANAQQPVAYVSKVNYGRALYVFASSEDDSREFRAALDAVFQQPSKPVSTRQIELLKRSKLQVIVVGTHEKTVKLEKDISPERLRELVKDFGVVTKELAHPLSCVLRYLKGNEAVSFPIAAEYEIVSYEPQKIITVLVRLTMQNDRPASQQIRLIVVHMNQQIGYAAFGEATDWRSLLEITLNSTVPVTKLSDLKLLVQEVPTNYVDGQSVTVSATCTIDDGAILHWFAPTTVRLNGPGPHEMTC